MEDGGRVLIYNGAMTVEVLCARRDCAMPALAGQRRKRRFGSMPTLQRAFVDTYTIRG
jgi:hypothetical protein